MEFLWPQALLVLLAVPIFALIHMRLDARRLRAAARFQSMGVSRADKPGLRGLRRHLPFALFLLALFILAFAMARPAMTLRLPHVEGTVILAFDVSGSMAADDMEPTRMEAAKAAARGFVDRQPATVEIGIVSFSEGGFAVQVPTNDQVAVIAAIDRLTPQRSTSLGSGILVALNTIAVQNAPPPLQYSNLTPQPTPPPTPMPRGQYASAVVVLLTDGENTTNPDPLVAAKTAADRGVRIYTVGIGSPAGADLTVDGFIIHTQLDEATLQQIAAISDGVYYNAESTDELLAIYDHLTPEFVIEPEKMEVTSLFAGAGILTLLTGGMISLAWFGRIP